VGDVATLTLRADISELQRKLRSIPDDASGAAKQMAVALERSFKQATAASVAAAKASGAAQASAARETERAVAKLAEYAAAGDPVEQLTLKFQRQAAEIERLGKLTGNTAQAQKALANASADYGASLSALTTPAKQTLDVVEEGATKAAGSTWKLQQQTMSLRKNVGDFANSLLAGQSPFTVLLQQGPQLAEIFGEAEDATELLQNSFGGLITKAKAAGAVLAVAAVAVAAAVTAYSALANATDDNADGNNRLMATFDKLTESVNTSSDAINKQTAALAALKVSAEKRREDLLVEIGAMDKHEVAAKRDAEALAEETREKMLAITATKARLVSEEQTLKAVYKNTDASVTQRVEAQKMLKANQEAIRAEDAKIAQAQQAYNQQLDDIDSTRLARQANDDSTASERNATSARKDRTAATKDAAKAERDIAAAYADVQGVVDELAAAGADAERKLGIEAAARIKVLTEIQDKYADQPDLIMRAASAESAVREQLYADTVALREKQDAEYLEARHKVIAAETEAFTKAEKTRHDLRMKNAADFANASSTFASGISDLLAQQSEANAKRDRALALRQFKASKAAAIAEATINGAVAITRALATLGPVAGALATAGISAATAAQVGVIAGQKPAFDRGGMIQGGSRMADQVPINALPGEAVLSRQAVRAVGGQTGVDALNRGEGQNSAPIVLPVYKHFGRFVRDELERSGALQRATFRGRPVGALGY
jgi:hypothetical protein